MQRREDEVPRERRLHGDLDRLAVADLAHQDDVGILPQQRTQPRGEGQVNTGVYLHLADALGRHGVPWEATEDGTLRVRIDNPAIVGHIAFQAGVELHELRVDRFDLEQLFFALTRSENATAQPTEPNPEAAP